METKQSPTRFASIDELKTLILAPNLKTLEYDELIRMLYESQAIYVNGHWELLSGNHTDVFFQFSKLGQYPKFVAKITQEILSWLRENIEGRIAVALSPVAAGRFLAFSIAAALNGQMNTRMANAAIDSLGRTIPSLKEGFELHPDENVLLVNDLITTGDGIWNLIKLARDANANPLAISVFANRNPETIQEIERESRLRVFSVVTIRANHWPKADCPLCKQNMPCRQSYQYHV